ncbi:TonB-dependent receptor plug domain-containing protein [Novosphingobium lindaniclasticum]|uniref:TonB-dependent receptor plug domain-containing protein n=1 Tax=Novosphingobium lindaniclasticum LE124 TaxID=1096930 RepID=T0HWF6_9SPHN|nr:TonB-dependent receptor plug domain-containing protein [Novosphingobium lindaniclasticum]EQB16498.1 hypothetical protein L284_09365 [Novosphingobium lindaniclasticum LE124]
MTAALLGAPLFAMPALAETEDQASARRGEITVTAIREDDSYAPKKATAAGKTPADILEIPQSVSVVTREQIEDRNFFTIGEALQQVTGITVMPFDGSNPDYRIWGSEIGG